MSDTEVSRKDAFKRIGGLAAIVGIPTVLLSTNPTTPTVDAVTPVDEDLMRAEFQKMFRSGAVVTAAMMTNAMMMATPGRIPKETP